MTYQETCELFGFCPDVQFVKIEPDGSISFTAGKPDEVLALLYQVRKHGLTPAKGLLDAVRRDCPNNPLLRGWFTD